MVLRISTYSIPYRKEFNSASKQADETLKNWYDRLKNLAQPCDYGLYSEAFILNQFICGLDTLILKYLNAEQKDLSVNDVFDLTKSFEHIVTVDVKQVLESIKTEELNSSDGEHFNDNNVSDSDDSERGTAIEVSNVRLNHEPIEEIGVSSNGRKYSVQATTEKPIPSLKLTKRFECYLCHNTFGTAGKLTYHFTRCHSIRKKSRSTVKRKIESQSQELPASFECYLCQKAMNTVGHLLHHFTLYHTIGKTSKCILCGKWNTKMVWHLNAHLNVKPFHCNMCDAAFRRHETLKKHLLNHSDPNVQMFKCSKCSKVFITRVQLKAHHKGHKQPERSLSEKLDDLIKKKKEQPTVNGKYNCDICATQFDKEGQLNVHSKVHNQTEWLCHLCGAKLSNKRNLMVHYRLHTGKPFQCDECGRKFSTKAKVNSHAKIHTDAGRPHQCTICQKAFIQKVHLAGHMKVHFPVNRRFKCDQCPKNFLKENQLARHTLSHAGITRPWQCNYCKKGFRTNYCREEHERTHTGVKPYACPICGKTFAQQSSLRGHRKVHLKPPKPKAEHTKRKRKQKKDNSIGSRIAEAYFG
ncbi:hypothetical protein HA402_003475 [Bradysia odoriphaga]|nr:hypothetical protein HA402_003475 [Bradysia odoriphaga]